MPCSEMSRPCISSSSLTRMPMLNFSNESTAGGATALSPTTWPSLPAVLNRPARCANTAVVDLPKAWHRSPQNALRGPETGQRDRSNLPKSTPPKTPVDAPKKPVDTPQTPHRDPPISPLSGAGTAPRNESRGRPQPPALAIRGEKFVIAAFSWWRPIRGRSGCRARRCPGPAVPRPRSPGCPS